MKKILLTALFVFIVLSSAFAVLPWSQRMANSTMLTNPTKYNSQWSYVTGTVMNGFQELYNSIGYANYLSYIEATVKASMGSFSTSTKTLDNIKPGTAVLFMYENTASPTDKTSYQNKVNSVRTLLNETGGISRTSEGGLWHKDPAYNSQMWGDGLYMAQPFYAQYSVIFNDAASEDFDDIANQFALFETHARDATTGLLYHGWSENPTNSQSIAWANPITGLSDNFWGRASGWYIMGLVDALDYFPTDHDRYQDMIDILNRLVPALLAVQDPVSGCWYDVLNLPDSCSTTRCNYLESSCTCMITYSILKAIRLGYVSNSYLPAAKKAYEGILSTFVTTNGDYVTIWNNCSVSGLGGNNDRDGSFDYYMSEPVVSSDDEGKPIGPFILASLEYEALPIETKVIEKKQVFFYAYRRDYKQIQIDFNLEKPQKLTVSLIDITGKKVKELLTGDMSAADFSEQYSLNNIPSGVYLVKCETEQGILSKKVCLY